MKRFNFVASGLGEAGWYLQNERGIQIDPATRTAWTYGPEASRFSSSATDAARAAAAPGLTGNLGVTVSNI